MNRVVRQLTPAEVYDEKFVPALFAQWGPTMVEAAEIRSGQEVLDVACGTGALTRAVADAVAPSGTVVGLDPNPDMLAVARSKRQDIDWQEGIAEALPFADRRFDAVVSQFGFMFFDDPVAALREMVRVLKPGGRLAVAVCGAIERSTGYAAFSALLDRLFGTEVGDAFRAPFALGSAEALADIAAKAGLPGATVEEQFRSVRFDSVAELVSTERACAWTLGGILDVDQFEVLLRESEDTLRPWVGDGGKVEFDLPALLLTVERRN